MAEGRGTLAPMVAVPLFTGLLPFPYFVNFDKLFQTTFFQLADVIQLSHLLNKGEHMSANSATIAFRVKPEIKLRADRLFERLGMTTSTGMNILLMQTLEHRGFPFAIKLQDDETMALIDDVRAAEEEIERGDFISQSEFEKQLRAEGRL
jgi:addiction module RelB/DinJ family antitoxin